MARVDLDVQTLDDLKAKLHGDIYTAIDSARMLAELEQAEVLDTRIIVTFYDKFYNPVGECGNYIDLQCAFPRNQVETGQITLAREDRLFADLALTAHETTVPITIEIGHLLWSGRIKIAHDDFNAPDRGDVVVCELEGDYAWLMKVVAWPNALFPIQAQFPPRGFAIGPAITVLKFLISAQFFRLQAGLWDIVNNLLSLNLDWRSWMGTLLMQDFGDDGVNLEDVMRVLRHPVYVVPTNALFDTTPLVSINWRMDKLGTIIEQTVKDNGLMVEVKLWRPGDPQPSDDIHLQQFPLTVPTIVIDIKDRMGIVGPTGTFLDGILRVAVDLAGSVFGEILEPFLNPNGEYKPDGWNIAPLLGVHFVEPWTIFNADHPQGGVTGRLSHHTPEAWRVIIGGKSPAWLNNLMNATYSWLLDMLMIVVGLTGVPSNLFDGLFNDVLLAFALADNMDRRIKMGPYGYPEVFIAGQSPFNIDGILTMKREMWNSRGYISGQVKFRQGEPYEVGRDVFPGGLATVIRGGKLYTDYIENIIIVDSRDERALVEVQIGDGEQEEAPIVKVQRKLIGYEELINIATLATQ